MAQQPAVSSSSSSSLKDILTLTQSLHQQSTLSLRQLVPVHNTLLRAVIQRHDASGGGGEPTNKKQDDEGASAGAASQALPEEDTTTAREIIEKLASYCSSSAYDQCCCRDILKHGSDREKLLAVQFLLLHSSAPFEEEEEDRQQPLKGLTSIVLPFLLLTPDNDPAEEEESISDDLTEAVLDAVFLSLSSSSSSSLENNEIVDQEDLSACLNDCCRQAKQAGGWKNCCRVLKRLCDYWASNNEGESSKSMVIESVTDLIVYGLEAAVEQPLSALRLLLRPMTDDLLPLVVDDSSDTMQERIWNCVWNLYDANKKDDSSSTQLATLLTVVTTALCTLLPVLLDRNVPVPNEAPDKKCQPVYHPLMWDLIYCCLSQGLQANKKLSWVEESWSNELSSSKNQDHDAVDAGTHQLLRRRGLYLLENISEILPHELVFWKKYVACFETLEMELAPHLVDQVWDTVSEISAQLVVMSSDAEFVSTPSAPPPLTWEWIKILLTRIITSNDAPALRKLSLYRLFKGQAGILLDDQAGCTASSSRTKKKAKSRSTKAAQRGAPLSVVSPEFVLEVVLLSFDTLESSVGSMMHIEENGQEVREDMNDLLSQFLDAYLETLNNDASKCEAFFRGLWCADIVCRLCRRTTVLVFTSIATSLRKRKSFRIPIQDDALMAAVDSLHSLFSLGSVVLTYREALLRSMSTMLAHYSPVGNLLPKTILSVLALFPIPEQDEEELTVNDDTESEASSWMQRDSIFVDLRQWLTNLEQEKPSWGPTFGATMSSAFVDGMLLSPSSPTREFDPFVGTTGKEKAMGKAVSLFCALIATYDDKGRAPTASELLWPAIHKGVSNVNACLVGPGWPNADRVARALLLLENGCKLRVLSGMGNGDLVVDRKTQSMMPPPPNIESILVASVKFILHHIQFLLTPSVKVATNSSGGSSRSTCAHQLSVSFAGLIDQLQTLKEGFPSSIAISGAVDQLLKENIELLSTNGSIEGGESVQRLAIVYATLSAGGEIPDHRLLKSCRAILSLDFIESKNSFSEEQSTRSLFQYAKWGSLSLLLPSLFDSSIDECHLDAFAYDLFDTTANAVEAAPINALVPLFKCVLVAANARFRGGDKDTTMSDENVCYLDKVIHALVSLLDDCKNSSDSMYMLDAICALLFQPGLLLDEAKRLRVEPDCMTPIRNSFRHFLEMAGRQRIHVASAVLSRIAYGWLVPGVNDGQSVGVAAIPYREDISDLLLHKEQRLGESSLNQSFGTTKQSGGTIVLPKETDESSTARGFVLVFLSKLPDVEEGLDPLVLSDLLHYLIFRLLEEIRPLENGLVMLGSAEYCRKIRGWQALCVLSRYVTSDIVEDVCEQVFLALSESLHGQIRYFIENFTINCARRHPGVFGKALIEQITRTDLSLHQISSFMIISGNLIVGRYRDDFFGQFENDAKDVAALDLVLAGVIPWLGSTQGFARAIAQLLVHQLIPLVIKVESVPTGPGTEDSDWYLRSIWRFLEENPEMKRLRTKQTKFFDRYDAEYTCTPEGVLSIPVDAGGEALPPHMVEVIKRSLKNVYDESHGIDAPTWKQMKDLINAETNTDSHLASTDEDSLVNFQRKIIPLDALNLALEDMRDRRLRNKAGRKKQDLIVCASLIDKVPNLGGLARTAEIFAADRLVIPDLRVTKMDTFKTLSVGARDWIEIEECKEENLLYWLRSRREEGYFVVGLEQTSSSVSLSTYTFPDRPIILLLGKEKEGIPVEYLQTVDQCVEIPQLGVIRSLNVHVSGAICIWEQTKQRIANGKLA